MLVIVFGCLTIKQCTWWYLMPHHLTMYLVKTSLSLLDYLRVKPDGHATWTWKIGQMMEDLRFDIGLGRRNK
jgi:hypothetical protein